MTVPCSRASIRSSCALSSSWLSHTALLAALLAVSACGDGDPSGLTFARDAEAVSSPEEPSDPDESDPQPPGKPSPVELPPDQPSQVDAGSGDDASHDAGTSDDAALADAEGPDAALSGDAASDDATTQDDDAGDDAATQDDGAVEAGLDASLPPEAGLDASIDSVGADTGTPDAAADSGLCADGGARDACGVCGGGATSCHPLFGRYAARTQLYARQRSELAPGTPEAQPLDLVSKGTLLSRVDIDAQGRVTEQYCLLELGGLVAELETDIASWTKPSASQRIPTTTLPLELSSGRYLRSLAAHRAYFGWLPDGAPTDCVAGQTHASGCTCASNAALPSVPKDCRVRDPEQDGVAGGNMYLTLGPRASDPERDKGMLELRLAAQMSFGWSLPATPVSPLIGTISGGLQLSELSRTGDVAELLGPVENTACPDNLGHIELVRNDSASCASIVAARIAAPESDGVFKPSLDAPLPAKTACVAPACSEDADTDGTPDCRDGCPADRTKTALGLCGCGTPDTNSDSDATPDCTDACPRDGAKTAEGLCGCGVADTNSDGDTLPNCTDLCPTNAPKTAPGVCGCAAADTDSDRDGVPNCNDACIDDAAKTTLGLCGCGVADTNSDTDTQPDCLDQCDNDGAKLAPGSCGCGVAETDGDGDGRPDCVDQCPRDAAKTAPGSCGCGTPDTNSDNDSLPDCTDACDNDASKVAALSCGCGVPETNSDGDSQADCLDQCDADRNKLVPGQCGCGVADADLDGNGSIDCVDSCPTDPAKVAPGLCGCGVADTNTDGDTQPNCNEECDADANKLVPGQCGCGVADTDADRDGVANCNDACPNDATKTASSVCGCGVPDTDTDRDGTPDCNDRCSADPNKIALGLCGCGVADTNTDGDAAPNCNDGCPTDASKVAAGVCGCGVSDTNNDGDAAPNCTDQCDDDRNKVAPGLCGCGVADTNADNDSQPACRDSCDSDAAKLAPGLCGCGVADTNTDGDSLPDCTDQCDNNASLTVPGACGCLACPSTNPLVGTYAVRTAAFGKQRNGSEVLTSKSLNYSLLTISENPDGTLRLADQGCWTQSLPNPDPAERGTKAYSWSKPAWVQAIPASVQILTANSNGTYTRTIPSRPLGWDPARQPASCTATATPLSPFPWGSSCKCNSPASSLPPYAPSAAPAPNGALYDCRLVDGDGDGQPGLSAVASTNAPTSPEASAPFAGGTAFAAINTGGSWLITPGSNGRHTATISDTSAAQLVGCTGLACAFLAGTPPGNVACPQALNRAQFVPVTSSSDSCAEIITTRDTLFVQNQDPAWPDANACPPPPQ